VFLFPVFTLNYCTSNTTQKYVFGHYTSLIASKNYLKVSFNVQYNFSVILYVAKNMVCFPVEDDGENLFHHSQKYWIAPRIGPTDLDNHASRWRQVSKQSIFMDVNVRI
jgi:hypothetical protein